MKNRVSYKIINIVVLLITIGLFVCNYHEIGSIFGNISILNLIIIILSALIVHFIKAGRLYLALYGSEISLMAYAKQYCKVTPVSVVFPFKLGELFRMYCYGSQLNSLVKGIVTIVFDRFVDTMALITVILLVLIFKGGRLSAFTFILILFLFFMLIVYYAFPRIYVFWKKYILRQKATEARLSTLKYLELLNGVYSEISVITKGRGIILYCMSLIAWAIEIGSIAIIGGAVGGGSLSSTISEYLESALANGSSVESKQFIIISVILMIAIYMIIKIVEIKTGKKDRK